MPEGLQHLACLCTCLDEPHWIVEHTGLCSTQHAGVQACMTCDACELMLTITFRTYTPLQGRIRAQLFYFWMLTHPGKHLSSSLNS
eukprot:1156115-Pelagomonas_calceolata.AAC.4